MGRTTIQRLVDGAKAAPLIPARMVDGVSGVAPVADPPVRTWADALKREQTIKAQLALAEQRAELVPVAEVRELLAGVSQQLYDSFGPNFWRWAESRGMGL